MLARHVRNLSQLHSLRAAGVPRQAWVSKIGVPPFVLDKLIGQARHYSAEALAQATVRLATADRALKGDLTLPLDAPYTGPQTKALGRDLAERVILEHAVGRICALATR
jgi:DNA polymerase III delta subunit